MLQYILYSDSDNIDLDLNNIRVSVVGCSVELGNKWVAAAVGVGEGRWPGILLPLSEVMLANLRSRSL